MALIQCPDCGKQVSDAVTACIGCGRPLRSSAAPSGPQPGSEQRPALIEQTSKSYKGQQLLAITGFCFGFVLTFFIGGLSDPNAATFVGVVVLLISTLLMINAKLGAWWHHG